MQVNVGGIAVETSDLRSEEQRQRDGAAKIMIDCLRVPTSRSSVPSSVDMYVSAAGASSWEEGLLSLFMPAFNNERDAIARETMAANIVLYCARHQLLCPTSVTDVIAKAATVTKRTQPQTTVFTKLVGADVKKRGAR
jgi:hypothetical protein